MATVYPSASGNWSDTSIWYSGGNPYGQIPQDGDVVYLNGCTITADMNINLGSDGQIRNDGDDGQGINAGGAITFSAGRTFTANLYCYNTRIMNSNLANSTITWVGNIYAENSSEPALNLTNYNNILNFTGDITAINSTILSVGNGNRNVTFTGDITLTNSSLISGAQLNYNNGNYITTINGDINATSGSFVFNLTSGTTNNGNLTINGDINCDAFLGGDIRRYLTITGNIVHGTGNFISGYVSQFSIEGTFTQGTGQIASYITTMNLDGTLNLSGSRPFTYGVQTLNVATGGRVTFDNHLYYCFNEINHVNSNFEITCRNQNLDNFTMKNKSVLATTYPAQNKVSQDYVYGLEDEFTGTYQLPDPANVLDGTHYGSKVGTLTLDISSSVASTIDDLEDTASTLLEEQPPLVKTLSATNLNTTSATITLSTQNTGATTTKTGVELDTDWMFSNPLSNEVNNVVNSVSISGLTGGTNYYARAYVVDDGRNVYSNNIIPVSTLLIPSELQLCEYLQTDGNCYINIRPDVFQLNNYSFDIKYKTSNGNEQSIWGCMYFRSIFTGSNNSTLRVSYGNTNAAFGGDNRNTDYQEAIHYLKNNTLKITNWSGTVLRNQTATMSTLTAQNLCLFGVYNNATGLINYMLSGGRIVSSNFATFDQILRLVSTYIKSGETYEDNKGNICSAGTAGFYDTINHIFYTNDGGGALGHGNDII